jgi:hypothetical protein
MVLNALIWPSGRVTCQSFTSPIETSRVFVRIPWVFGPVTQGHVQFAFSIGMLVCPDLLDHP